ncbi:MAG: response regulator transcription factor [Anaerolineae bacterium]|nr:response regulator transcription factor [Chloroflexota bacterium]MBN8639037.1 response regulator transcription factor [Anaerolineae bacterium]
MMPAELQAAAPVNAKRVLIAEDNADLRKLFSYVFQKNGYAVHTVADGQRALDFLNTQPLPDVIILDVNMPYVSGLDLLQHVRATSTMKHVQVILVSGNSTVEHAPEAALADLMLIKPVSPNDLVTLADRLII